MSEIIVKLNSNHIKVRGCEYVADLVRCKDCKKRTDKADADVGKGYCKMLAGYTDDCDYCSWVEPKEQ